MAPFFALVKTKQLPDTSTGVEALSKVFLLFMVLNIKFKEKY